MTPFSPPPARERVISGDLHRRELVGLHARIVSSCNPEIVGASGRVVGETRNMLVMQARRPAGRRGAAAAASSSAAARARLYPKAGSVWRFCAPGDASSPSAASADLDGSSIARRPEDRLRSRAPPAAASGGGGGGTGRTGGGAA